MPMDIQEAQRTPNRQEKNFFQTHNNQNNKRTKYKILKAVKEEGQKPIRAGLL